MTPTSNGTGKITIVTHSSGFHTDDIFAVATLILLLGEENVSVVRSRDMEVIKNADYVADVGGVYDPDKNRFDHHQEGGAGVRENTIPYASFGLVWQKFGQQICGSKETADRIDQILAQPIDAIDNGVQIIRPIFDGIYPYNLYDFFDAFVPSWKEDKGNIDDIFLQMVSYAKGVLNREILKHKNKLEGNDIVKKYYDLSQDKRLIVLDRHYPFNDILSKFPEPLFVVFPKEDGEWLIHTIRNEENSFVSRKNLPKEWAGKTSEDLEKITGISGIVFCHPGRFIAGAKTKDAILQLAKIALDQ